MCACGGRMAVVPYDVGISPARPACPLERPGSPASTAKAARLNLIGNFDMKELNPSSPHLDGHCRLLGCQQPHLWASGQRGGRCDRALSASRFVLLLVRLADVVGVQERHVRRAHLRRGEREVLVDERQGPLHVLEVG